MAIRLTSEETEDPEIQARQESIRTDFAAKTFTPAVFRSAGSVCLSKPVDRGIISPAAIATDVPGVGPCFFQWGLAFCAKL